jgi:signal transduction histidine kinase
MSSNYEPDTTIWSRFRGVELPSRSYVIGLGIIGGIGFGSLGIHLSRLLRQSAGFYTTVGQAFSVTLSLVVIGAVIWIHRRPFEDVVGRIGTWCFVGATVLVAVSVLSITHQRIEGVRMTDPLFAITGHATLGAILGLLVGVYDGQRKKRGEELRCEQKRTRQLNNQLTVLNRILRHDIRNCVSVIFGYTEVDDSALPKTKIRERARELQKISEKAQEIEGVLTNGPDSVTEIDIASVIREKTHEFETDYPEIAVETELPESAVVQAPARIGAVVEELLENGVKHNDTEEPELTVRIPSATADFQTDGGERSEIVIQVCDNGPGIPKEELRVLNRGHETALKHTSGLGLWLVQWAVMVVDGQIIYKTNQPRGSIIEIWLPIGSN